MFGLVLISMMSIDYSRVCTPGPDWNKILCERCKKPIKNDGGLYQMKPISKILHSRCYKKETSKWFW